VPVLPTAHTALEAQKADRAGLFDERRQLGLDFAGQAV
jgi:hypothetical protein